MRYNIISPSGDTSTIERWTFFMIGIYKITCLTNGKVYIGATHNSHKRFEKHNGYIWKYKKDAI